MTVLKQHKHRKQKVKAHSRYLSNSSTELALQHSLEGLQLGRGQLPTPLQSVQQLDHSAHILPEDNTLNVYKVP